MGILSPRVFLVCGLFIILALYLQNSDAWRRRSFRTPRVRIRVRRVVPNIRVRRVIPSIRVRRVIPTIRGRRIMPRIRIPSLRRIAVPRLRRVCVTLGQAHIRLGSCSNPGGGGQPVQPNPEPEIPNMPTPQPQLNTSPSQLNTTDPAVEDPCAGIQSREEWEAPSVSPTQLFPFAPVKKLALYVDGINCTTREACKQQAKDLHRESKSYNFIIGTEGTVFQGMGFSNVSNHIDAYNLLELGVAFIGDCLPSEVALDSVNALVNCGTYLEKMSSDMDYAQDIVLRFPDCAGNY